MRSGSRWSAAAWFLWRSALTWLLAAGSLSALSLAGTEETLPLVACSISLIGSLGGGGGAAPGNGTAAQGPPAAFRLACWADAGGSSEGSNTSVEVRAGAELYSWLNNSSTGGGGGTGGQGGRAQLSGVRISLRQPVANTSGGGGGLPDWGLTIVGIPRLRLVDSVLSDMPLSPAGPLLEVLGCAELSIRNMTLAGLTAPSPPAAAFGAVRIAGALRRADVQGMACHDVTGASGWACLLLSSGEDGGEAGTGRPLDPATSPTAQAISITDSNFTGNTVRGFAEPYGASCSVGISSPPAGAPPAGPSLAASGALGFGAVLVLTPGGRQSGMGAVAVALHNTALSSNTGGCGGALSVAGSSQEILVAMEASAAANNSAVWGGAVFLGPTPAPHDAAATADIALTNASSLGGNTAAEGGGAVFVSGANATCFRLIGGSSVSRNRALAGSGGALLVADGTVSGLRLQDSALDNNTARFGSGGAVSVAAGGIRDVYLYNSSLSGNAAHRQPSFQLTAIRPLAASPAPMDPYQM
ncbi:hypothetical protein HYH03_014389 [Edaphochlamys debaryana]|uniref:Uncharacterized protein n=1 Tax=Edaphochlamys debaryana TaxID=47281 RepID=A0A835XNX4_9CHLO|nr:hypothetical protein HYH03_014389 [Edaphochlamys debaryana]|eukprot:KAG2487019.1 hypothetical protein HYH03_014389 [Edaphochlamys debaryana]